MAVMTPELKGYAKGGYVIGDEYPITGTVQFFGEGWGDPIGYTTTEYKIVSGYKMLFTKTDDEGNSQIVEVQVLPDGTVHVDAAAFTLMMGQLGFVKGVK